MTSSYYPFHLFSAQFASQLEAENFVFEQWEPKPPASVSDEEYSAWEDRNPSWLLADELEFYIDSDFVELANCSNSGYIQQLIENADSRDSAIAAIPKSHTHLIIIDTSGIYGDRRSKTADKKIRQPESTKSLKYIGTYNAEI